MTRPMAYLATAMLGCLWASGIQAQQELMIYPNKKQSKETMEKDKFECYSWAKKQSGFDPMAPRTAATPPPAKEEEVGGAGKGAVGGALLGAGIGYLTGNTARGAAIGGVSGAAVGGMRRSEQKQREEQRQKQWEQQKAQQYSQGRNNYNRAYAACLEGRGYTVR